MSKFSRIMLAAPASGSGKTTVTLALLAALQKGGYNPRACKCGPDYIDTMFQQQVLGIPSRNLDLFLCPKDIVGGLLRQHAEKGGITVIEGVMGYYDGIGGSWQASSYDVALSTNTPVILVLSARGSALSLAAMACGFKDFRSSSQIRGLILNNCSEKLYAKLKAPLEEASGLPLLGYLPHLQNCIIESRHLGLVTAAEIEDIRIKLDRLGRAAEASIDLEALLKLAATAQPINDELPLLEPITSSKPRIAIAYDKAFCFYYQENLQLLSLLGAETVFFSPLNDTSLPPHIAGLYIGGGYPELYAEKLSANKTMLSSIKAAINGGLPTLAECGGFLYLQQTLDNYTMVGALPGEAFETGKLQRFGYTNLQAQHDNMLCRAQEIIPAHEFHYWDTTAAGKDFLATKPNGDSYRCIVAQDNLFAGFPHLYFWGNIKLAQRFVAKAAAYGGK